MNNENKTNTGCCRCCGVKYYGHGEDELCYSCDKQVKVDIAESSVLQHFWDSIVFFFNFEFLAFLGSFSWGIEKLFGIGDYNPDTGYFYTSKILKRKK